MTKISNLYALTNYVSANSSGNVVIAAPSSGYALDVTGTGRFTGATLTLGSATAATNVKLLLNGVASKAAGIEFQQSGTAQWYIGNGIASEDNNFELYNSNGTMAMKIIKSTNAIAFQGATTFSSSVTASGLTLLGPTGAGTGPSLIWDRSGGYGSFYANYAYENTYYTGGSTLDFKAGNSVSLLRLVSNNAYTAGQIHLGGNVGIGMTNPSRPLHTYSTATTTGAIFETNAANSYIGLQSTAGTCYVGNVGYAMTFEAGGSERLRITSGGDLAIGTTTVSWASTNRRVVEINGTSQVLIGIKVGDVQKGYHYHNGTNLYTENSHSGGNWYLAQVGAGNMYLNTNGVSRISITSGGNVGIGTDSPNARMQVLRGSNGNVASFTSDVVAAGNYSGITLNAQTVGTDDWYGSEIRSINTDGNPNFLNPRLSFFTQNPSTYLPSGRTEKMCILGNGNVGVGTSGPSNNLQVNAISPVFALYSGQTDTTTNLVYSTLMFKSYAGLYNQQFQQPDAQIQIVRGNHSYNGHQSTHDADMVFSTNDNVNGAGVTERMRIWSTGELVLVANSGGSNHIRFINNNGAYWEIFNATNYNKFTFIYQGSYVADINPSSGAYTALSDQRLKKDIELSNIGLSTVMALEPTLYRMNTDSGEDKKQLGFIAQQVQSVLPEACSEVGEYLGVQDRPILAAAIKAIQELSAKVTALENK